jgi:mycoredoxin
LWGTHRASHGRGRGKAVAVDMMGKCRFWCIPLRGAAIAVRPNASEKYSIAYTEIDIESTPGAAEEVIQHVGKRAIPQFVVDGKWIQPYRPGRGFLHQEMEDFFRVGNTNQPLV